MACLLPMLAFGIDRQAALRLDTREIRLRREPWPCSMLVAIVAGRRGMRRTLLFLSPLQWLPAITYPHGEHSVLLMWRSNDEDCWLELDALPIDVSSEDGSDSCALQIVVMGLVSTDSRALSLLISINFHVFHQQKGVFNVTALFACKRFHLRVMMRVWMTIVLQQPRIRYPIPYWT